LKLGKSASITGSVIDEKTRRPLSGVRVAAETPTMPFLRGGESRSRTARTDAKGRFRIAGIAARPYTVRASKADYLPSRMQGITPSASAPAIVAIALKRAAGISGRVTDEAGAAVGGARVRFARDTNVRALMRGDPSSVLGRAGATTGADGAFRLRGLTPEKNRTLEAAKAGWVTAKRHGVTLKIGEQVKDVRLVLRKGLEARGRVVDSSGQPVAGAEVRVSQPERGGGRMMIQLGGLNRVGPDA